MIKIISESFETTEALGEAVGRHVPPGTVLALSGDLGAGKTVFAKGLARGLGIGETVKSPTFVIMEQYASGRLPLFHVDAYRVTDEELTAIGFEECLDGNSVVLIEWAENAASLLPGNAVPVSMLCSYEGGKEWREIIFRINEGEFPWLEEAIADVDIGD